MTLILGWPSKVEKSGVHTTNGDFIECDSIIVSSGYEYDFSFLDNLIKLGCPHDFDKFLGHFDQKNKVSRPRKIISE